MKAKSSIKGPRSAAHVTDSSSFQLGDDRILMLPFGRKELNSEEYLKWMNDPEVTKTIGRYDYLMPVTRKKLAEYFEHLDENTVFLAIYLKQRTRSRLPGKFIGTLKIYDIDAFVKRASLGILIGEKREWGKGYAQRAIRLASHYIFEVLGLSKIAAGYVSTNAGMARAFMKNGFVQEGILKEHVFCCGKPVDHVLVGKFRGGS